MSVLPQIGSEIFTFFEQNNNFETLQVRKKSGIYGKVNKSSILKYPQRYTGIQVNSSCYINALAFDCDHEDIFRFLDFNMPSPSVTSINKHNGKHHHLYYLKDSIPLDYANIKTSRYLADIYNGMATNLEADRSYSTIITKNFMNPSGFKIYGNLKRYCLSDFSESIKKKSQWNNQLIRDEDTFFSRHIKLFNDLRYRGYSIAKKCDRYDLLYSELNNFANIVNEKFENKIKVKHIVNNVANFCWENRLNFNNKRWNWDGYIKQDKELSFKNRSIKQTIRRRKEMLDKSPLNFKNINL
ncbi:replication initiation protein [Poseidonibacter ostreae]|uniref:Primase C-terminal 1 domain-containing protein n=1 Tax=Poseidonibacter ostreae TaxID=2654171 RepID=A0A6L4WU37_9BACT|nr:replication initiation protein [Poseidonibacter ostreae]KAB7888871.1 hypothetical protein GBG18_12205 [Poseidonibacter ostreae]KAB7889638.1 hypothetical protein GBG19_05365 [Poseidonibacter ostreae]